MQQVQLFKNPAFAGAKPAQAFVAQGKTDSLSDGIGQGYGVIYYTGKQWSLRYRGERKYFVHPVEGTPISYIDVVILGQAPTKSKSYFKKWSDAQSSDRPICSSMDGIVPDDDVEQKQAETCALCPHNIWKTDPNTGRKGRECTDYKRLAVLLMPNQTKPMFGGSALVEPVFLRIPPASLQALAQMGDLMQSQGFPYNSFITRISFDVQQSYPQMVFEPIQPLNEKESELILQLTADPLVSRITTGEGAPAATKLIAQQPTQILIPPPEDKGPPLGATAPLAATPALAAPPPQPAPAPQVVAVAPPQQQAPPAETGLLEAFNDPQTNGPLPSAVTDPTPTVLAAAPPQQTVADAGKPQIAGADLDAKVAALLKAKLG